MAEEREALVPIEEKAVEFYEDQVRAVAVEIEGQRRVFVPIKPISDYLGLDWSGQYQRIQRDPVLSDEARLIGVTPINPQGGRPEALALPLEFLHGWLFSISANRVKKELREKIIRYQRECYQVLYDAFRSSQIDLADTTEAMMHAMRENARQQLEIWDILLKERQRLRLTEEVVQLHDDQLLDHELRLARLQQEQAQLRSRLADVTRILPAPSEAVGPQQKARLQELVKELVASAQDRGARLGQGRNDYAAVWTAFNQRFRIAKYAELPASQFDEAVHWLEAWIERVREQD